MQTTKSTNTSCSMDFDSGFSSSSLSLVGDCIGMESCVEMEGNVGVNLASEGYKCDRVCSKKVAMKKKEFPPPIPFLARTESLPSHMPWVLKRYYTDDGRLILREEKVKHHEYFEAHRSNGRLTLNLVPLDDDDDGLSIPTTRFTEDENDYLGDDQSDLAEEGVEEDGTFIDGDFVEDQTETEENVITLKDDNGGRGGNGALKCLNYHKITTGSPCFFDMAVPAIRPVLT